MKSHSKRPAGTKAIKALWLAVPVTAFLFGLGRPAQAAVFTVNSTVDAVDANIGNGVCATITAVDSSKAFLVFSDRLNDASPAGCQITGQVTNSMTLSFQQVGTGAIETINNNYS